MKGPERDLHVLEYARPRRKGGIGALSLGLGVLLWTGWIVMEFTRLRLKRWQATLILAIWLAGFLSGTILGAIGARRDWLGVIGLALCLLGFAGYVLAVVVRSLWPDLPTLGGWGIPI